MRKVADSLPMYCRDCGKWLAVRERDLCRPCAKDRQEDAELEAYLDMKDINDEIDAELYQERMRK